MGPHEEYRELCAAATAGELSAGEWVKLNAHLAVCPECRRTMSEYETAAQWGVAALNPEVAPKEEETDGSWSVEKAEEAFFKRLDKEQIGQAATKVRQDQTSQARQGQRFTYRPSQIHWRAVLTTFSAAA